MAYQTPTPEQSKQFKSWFAMTPPPRKGDLILEVDRQTNTWQVTGNIALMKNADLLPYKFHTVSDNFFVSNKMLKSLENMPKRVGGSLRLNNNQLTTLQGAPKHVGGDVEVWGNPLESLEGLPEKVGGTFYLTYRHDLPLLRLLHLNSWWFLSANGHLFKVGSSEHKVLDIMKKYEGQGRQGSLACGAELARAGFKENARW